MEFFFAATSPTRRSSTAACLVPSATTPDTPVAIGFDFGIARLLPSHYILSGTSTSYHTSFTMTQQARDDGQCGDTLVSWKPMREVRRLTGGLRIYQANGVELRHEEEAVPRANDDISSGRDFGGII